MGSVAEAVGRDESGRSEGRPDSWIPSFRHDAFLYDGEEQFLTGTAAFVRDGLEAGEAVLVAVVEPRASLLKAELGADADRVEFLDMAEVGRNPARIIPAWETWADRQTAADSGFRGIGEPIWAGRTSAEIAECQQHEQLLNIAFDDGPGWWLLCPYDTRALPGAVIDRARGSHPGFVAGDGWQPSASYPEAGFSMPEMFGDPLDEPTAEVAEFAYDVKGLRELRRRVEAFAEAVLGRRGADNAALVVDELATNSVMHGGGAGLMRMWREGRTVVFEARDQGTIMDPLVGRRRPVGSPTGRAGLWIVNQLCDLLQIRSDPERGTVVRAYLAEE